MPKEPGEPNIGETVEDITPAEGQRRAESILMHFNQVLEDIEEDNRVNLDNASKTHSSRQPKEMLKNGKIWGLILGEKTPWTKRQALKTTFEQLEQYLNYLPQDLQDEAHKLIVRARIYIVDDEFTQEQKERDAKE